MLVVSVFLSKLQLEFLNEIGVQSAVGGSGVEGGISIMFLAANEEDVGPSNLDGG